MGGLASLAMIRPNPEIRARKNPRVPEGRGGGRVDRIKPQILQKCNNLIVSYLCGYDAGPGAVDILFSWNLTVSRFRENGNNREKWFLVFTKWSIFTNP